MPIRFMPALALAAALLAPASVCAMEAGLPATMSVEVTSIRQGKPWRSTVAKVRPGDGVLLRDETGVPYVRAADSRGTRTENATSGVVASVVPAVRGGRLLIDFTSTVREVAGFDTARVPVPGKPDAVISLPNVRERTYEASVEPTWSGGAWRAVQSLGDSGYGVSVVAKPLAAQAAANAPVNAPAKASAGGGRR